MIIPFCLFFRFENETLDVSSERLWRNGEEVERKQKLDCCWNSAKCSQGKQMKKWKKEIEDIRKNGNS